MQLHIAAATCMTVPVLAGHSVGTSHSALTGDMGAAGSMQQPDYSSQQDSLSTAVSQALHAADHAAALHSMQAGQSIQPASAVHGYRGLHPQQPPMGLQDGQMGMEYLLSAPQPQSSQQARSNILCTPVAFTSLVCQSLEPKCQTVDLSY